AAPVTDTVKRGREGLVMATLDRSNLHLAQTPQAFLFDLIRRAHDEDRGGEATDDAVLMEQAGHKVRLVAPSGPNFKVTTADDLVMVEALLRREGHGQA
ncbi:2-C-methyl-D-erythritol 4-phosphate cytidylyltransferase, partial [candidate division GN15 bacterium]|nr:2-C-methyl-D-erythritol 4-phosphate cytidylyltransferase [candidate division GN15 bacterium]